jgi:hypothetical protein
VSGSVHPLTLSIPPKSFLSDEIFVGATHPVWMPLSMDAFAGWSDLWRLQQHLMII